MGFSDERISVLSAEVRNYSFFKRMKTCGKGSVMRSVSKYPARGQGWD